MPASSYGFKAMRGGTRKSLHNPATYDALRRCGMSKQQAAMISNGILKRGVKRGVHRGRSRC